MDSAKTVSELENLKNKLRATWIAGDFGKIAKSIDAGARQFVEQLDIKKGCTLLDVACGTGNTTLPAARLGAQVVGIDIAQNLIKQAIERRDAEGIDIRFDIGDAEDLPYADGSFDVVLTMFGAMFAPRPDVTANELKRVCRPGGFVAMANWTPDGFIGQMFKTVGKFVKPPAGMPSPLLWGTEDRVRERFANGITVLELSRRNTTFTFPFPPADVVEYFRLYYGPTQKAFESLDAGGRSQLRAELEYLWSDHNQATDGTTKVDSEYLSVRAVRS